MGNVAPSSSPNNEENNTKAEHFLVQGEKNRELCLITGKNTKRFLGAVLTQRLRIVLLSNRSVNF